MKDNTDTPNRGVVPGFPGCLLTAAHLHSTSLSDFGYEQRTQNGQLAIGVRPLLVILACFDTNESSARFANCEHDLNKIVGLEAMGGPATIRQ